MERAQDRYEADMYDAFYDGKDEGRLEGRRDQALQIARELKKLNLPIETIYKGTGLPPDVIESL
jgi:predicted transposase/invertase (TIGR01784 family)